MADLLRNYVFSLKKNILRNGLTKLYDQNKSFLYQDTLVYVHITQNRLSIKAKKKEREREILRLLFVWIIFNLLLCIFEKKFQDTHGSWDLFTGKSGRLLIFTVIWSVIPVPKKALWPFRSIVHKLKPVCTWKAMVTLKTNVHHIGCSSVCRTSDVHTRYTFKTVFK